jgi:hypothetical protein
MKTFTEENNPFSKYLFWDIDIADLDLDVHKMYVVERVLDYGQWEDYLYIRDYYGIEELKNIAMRIRFMFPESLSFIATVTHTSENQFRCYDLLQSKKHTHLFV